MGEGGSATLNPALLADTTSARYLMKTYSFAHIAGACLVTLCSSLLCLAHACAQTAASPRRKAESGKPKAESIPYSLYRACPKNVKNWPFVGNSRRKLSSQSTETGPSRQEFPPKVSDESSGDNLSDLALADSVSSALDSRSDRGPCPCAGKARRPRRQERP
jgi:hypothetical protein